ncbi:MAG TPA: tRNA 2-thiouridine(34) synthase MnmA [Acidimicrobiales bacterium]|nr:tRNA 2-thiouridine(34) synthase MnmA [Acidimicrobiales bacterium]
MRVMVAMSGGVDSSVAAGLLVEAGHEVVGATLKLWGGLSDSGCCSVADVDDARTAARQLDVPHHVFNLAERFETSVVDHYVEEHRRGRTPNPCIECNRHVKFGTLLERARRLGFDALATGHHARVVHRDGAPRLARGVDRAKDQSYVLSMLTCGQLAEVVLPIGSMTKAEVRAHAERLRLVTASKPDSQDVCFIQSGAGRRRFLEDRLPLHEAQLVDAGSGAVVGSVDAVELVTVGQRRGLGVAVDGRRRFALSVDVGGRRVVVGDADAASSVRVELEAPTWVEHPLPPGSPVLAQTSAHGAASPGTWDGRGLVFDRPQRGVAPGQTVAFYDPRRPDLVVGAAIAARAGAASGPGSA